jgi:hypothetical protein
VDVTVGGDVVKTLYETATTSAAAIAKAKHKMRGAVSSAGAFKFKATETGEPEHQHATKKSAAQLQHEIDEALALRRKAWQSRPNPYREAAQRPEGSIGGVEADARGVKKARMPTIDDLARAPKAGSLGSEKTHADRTLQAELPEYKGWRSSYEYPGFIQYAHPAGDIVVLASSDFNGDGKLDIQIQTADFGRSLDDGENAAWPHKGRTAKKLFARLRPYLNKYQPR